MRGIWAFITCVVCFIWIYPAFAVDSEKRNLEQVVYLRTQIKELETGK